MKTRLSILAAFFFLGLLIAPSLYWIGFLYQRHEVREVMEKRIKADVLTTIYLKQLHWYKKGKEIIVNRHLFDVQAITKIESGEFVVTGLYDTQEQQLHKSLDAAVNKETRSKEITNAVLKLLLFSSLIIDKPLHEHEFVSGLSCKVNEVKQEKLPVCFFDIILPPPDFMNTLENSYPKWLTVS